MAEPLRRCRPLLGTFVEVAADRDNAIEAAFAAIGQVHRLMSAHEPDSDVSRINRFGHVREVKVHEWTARAVERAFSWSKRSKGAVDIVAAGKAAIEHGLIPRHADQPLPEAAHWTWLEAQGACVRLLKPGCIDLGGIAKGFAVDRAVEAMRRAGATRGLVNAGGDLFGFGEEPWTVAVVDPLTRRPAVEFRLRNEAVATSAIIGGSSAHLLGGGRLLSVTVRAATACSADALTKIVWAAPANLRELLDQAGASAFGIRSDGGIEEISSEALAA
jgi:thiamine biosynthesis lipoprotein